MPMPRGTYLASQTKKNAPALASKAKVAIKEAEAAEVEHKFYAKVDKVGASRIRSLQKYLSDLRTNLEKREPEPAKGDDKQRKLYAEALKQVRELLGEVRDMKKLEKTVHVRFEDHARVVIRAKDSAPDMLMVVIALIQVCEVLVRVCGRKR